MRKYWMLLVMPLCMLLSGCPGGGGPKSVVEAMNKAGEAKDWGAMFDNYSKASQEKMTDRKPFEAMGDDAKHPIIADKTIKECKAMSAKDYFVAMMKAMEGKEGAQKPEKYEIIEEKIDGDKGTCKVKGSGGEVTLKFVKEGDAWKIDM